MSDLSPFNALLAGLSLLVLSVSLALGLAGELDRGVRPPRLVSRPLGAHLAQLAARLRAPAPAVPNALTASPIAIQVLVDDPALRDRVRRHIAKTLAQGTDAMGTPIHGCAVIVAQGVERDGRHVRGCVERLSFPDGRGRAMVSLPLHEGSQALSLDEIAARLVRYYPEVTGAERTVVLTDDLRAAPTPTATSPAAPLPPTSPSLVPMPAGTRAGVAPAEAPNGRVARH